MAENLKFIFSADLSDFQKKLQSVSSQLKDFGNKMKDIGSDLSTYISLPLAALGGAAIKAFGDIQALKQGLTAITGSAAEANSQFIRLKELAKLPGLGLKEVAKGSISLQVIGFSAEKAEKSIAAFGNAVASVGGSRDQFERAAYGLAQLANTDFPLGEDLNIIKDAIPQVTPLLKEAFGTARSDDLQKLGITSRQVVDTIVNGLSKLPKVTGGVNNAFENLKDGVVQNLAEIGEIINNTVDISAFSDRLVAGISKLTEGFKNLSPETQTVALAIAGLAIIIPPLILAIGVFVSTVLPALIAGFTVLTGGIGLVVAAIVAGIALIIANWDSISAYFTSGEGSQWWDTVKVYAIDLFDSLVSIFNSIKDFVVGIWQVLGKDVLTFVSASFSQVFDVIKLVLGSISGVFKIFSSVIKGNWKGAWDGLKSIFITIWNGITSILKNFLSQIASGLAIFFKTIGADGIGNALSGLPSVFDSLFSKIQIPVDKATNSIKDFNKEVAKTVTPKVDTISATVTPKSKDVKTDQKRNIKGVKEDVLFDSFRNSNATLTNIKTPNIKPLLEFKGILTQAQLDIAVTMQKMNESISGAISDAVGNLASGFGEMIGQMAAGNMGMEGVVGGLMSILGDLAIRVGKIAIATVIGIEGITVALKTLNPFVAIAAGVALVALGSFVKSSISSAGSGSGSGSSGGNGNNKPRMFANGGIVSTPTYAMFGEYPSAGRGNPEVVAPLNKLKGMISETGGIAGDVTFRIAGDSLVGTLNNYNKKQYRTQ